MFTSVAQANAAAIEQIRRARPHWLDSQLVLPLISELKRGQNTASTPSRPMRWQEMTGPMKGAVGVRLSEGWADWLATGNAEQGKNFIPVTM